MRITDKLRSDIECGFSNNYRGVYVADFGSYLLVRLVRKGDMNSIIDEALGAYIEKICGVPVTVYNTDTMSDKDFKTIVPHEEVIFEDI